MTPESLLALFDDPIAAGRHAVAIRTQAYGRAIALRNDPALSVEARTGNESSTPANARLESHEPLPTAERALLLRDGLVLQLSGLPSHGEIRRDDLLVVEVDPTIESRRRFAEWLSTEGVRFPESSALAPTSPTAAGLHRLWCFAAARIALPTFVRIVARHDLIGIRLAQLAIGFGADTLAGPLQSDRKLPLAGVTRPDETTLSGLVTLVQQAGFEPIAPHRTSNPLPADPRDEAP